MTLLRRVSLVTLVALTACPRPQPELSSVTVLPETARLARGERLQYVATATYTDGRSEDVTAEGLWSVDDAFVGAAAAEPRGLIAAEGAGQTVVRLRYGGRTITRPLTVVDAVTRELQLDPPHPVLAAGLGVRLQVTALRSDGTKLDVTEETTWASSSPGVAQVEGGLLRARAPGSLTLTASAQGLSVSAPVDVTNAQVESLDVQPAELSLALGITHRLSATALLSDGSSADVTPLVTWRSSAPAIAFASELPEEAGLIAGRAVGTATVTAGLLGKSAGSSVTVTSARLLALELGPQLTTLARGTSQRLTATGTFSDGSRADLSAQVTWRSSNEALFSVTDGLVRALAPGLGTVSASLGPVTVGRELRITDAVLQRIDLQPEPVRLPRGLTLDVAAVGTFSDGSQQPLTASCVWRVTDGSVASVSNATSTAGRVSGLAEGNTELTATFAGISGRTQLTVSAAALVAVQVSPGAMSLPRGTSRALSASGLFSDGTTQDLTAQATWVSSAPGSVSVSSLGASRGVATALAQGSAEVRATVGGLSGTTRVTVTDARLEELQLSPSQPTLPRGVTERLVATGVFSDGSTSDLSTQVTWSTASPAVASVSNAPGTQGELRALQLGATVVTAQLGGVQASAPVTVTAATLTALELSPGAATLAVGLSRDFIALGTFSDGTTQELTGQASFSVLDPAVASVVGARVTARAAGGTRLVATSGALRAEASLTITPAQLTGLSISPAALTLARGTTAQLTATASFSDGTTSVVTGQVSWSSSDAAVTVSATGALEAVQVGSAAVRAQLGGLSASSSVQVSPATLTAIEVTPASPSVPLGATQPFVATGRYSDGSAQELTAQATWASSAPAVLSVSNAAGSAGRASALSQGSATLSATFQGTTGSTVALVTAASLSRVELTPAMPRLAKDTRIRLTATGVWSDGGTQELTQSCTWSSQSPAIATVSNAAGARGQVTGVAAGAASLTATCSGVSGSTTLTVTNATLGSIELSPAAPTAAAGFTRALTATGHFSDGSTQPFTDFVTWSSADPAVASVSNQPGQEGVVSALVQGTASITAQALGVTGAVSFTVSAAILSSLELSPATASTPRGLTRDFVATGRFSDGTSADLTQAATWSSSLPAVATISNASGSRGRASAASEGVTTISASASGKTASATFTVTAAVLSSLALSPPGATWPRGLSRAFTATGTYSDGTTADLTEAATWSVDTTAAAVSNVAGSRGVVQGLEVGAATLRASSGSAFATATLTITQAALVSIGVTPANPSLPRGLSRQLIATGVYTDGTTADLTTQVSWSSSDGAVSSVSNAPGSEGVAQAVAVGSAALSATKSGVTGQTTVTVTPAVLQAIELTPPSPSVAAGLSTTLVATGRYSDGSTQDLSGSASWSTADASIATASAGVATGHRAGATAVSAAVGGVSGSTPLTVTAAVLQQLQVTPQNVSRPRGLSQQFTATGVFSDGSTAELTGAVTWSSSNPATVSVSNASGSQGLGSALSEGPATVSASLGAVTGSTPFTVTAAALMGLTVTPGGSTAPLGSVRPYTATGSYTDGSTQNLTAAVAWSSSNAAVASISNASGSQGLATTLSTGVTTIRATSGGFTASSNLIVIQNALTRIDLTPSSGGTSLGYSRQFIAIGTYADGTTQVLTSVATWSTSDAGVAIVSNAEGSRGLLSTVGMGSVTVSATHQGVTGSAPHTVTQAVLVALDITPGALSLAAAASAQLQVTGYFSDGSSQDLTTSVTWSSAAPGVAQASNASGSQGLVTGLSPGTATISAAQGSLWASIDVTVY